MNLMWRRPSGKVSGAGKRAKGRCGHCGEQFCLDKLGTGSRVEVCGIRCGCKARSRLASLGLIPGSRVHVVANSGVGPLLLSVGESRLMVERTIARKVMVNHIQ